MIAAVLNALGLGAEPSHAERHRESAERISAIETARAAEVAQLEAAVVSARQKAEAAVLTERAKLEAADTAAGDAIAAGAVSALSAAWRDYTNELSRASLQKLAALLRELDSKARITTGAELMPALIVASFAQGMITARPETEGALLSAEFVGDILSPAGRLLRGACNGADVVDLESQASAIETWFAKRCRTPGAAPSKEQREAFAVLLRSGRHADRANRLQALAEKHGKIRQTAFEADYVPATQPIKSHTHFDAR